MDYSNNNRSSYSSMASQDEIKASLHRIDLKDKDTLYGSISLDTDDGGAVYVEHEDIHTLIMGTTGSKKTRFIAMPA